MIWIDVNVREIIELQTRSNQPDESRTHYNHLDYFSDRLFSPDGYETMVDILYVLDWREVIDFFILSIWCIGVWFIIDVL